MLALVACDVLMFPRFAIRRNERSNVRSEATSKPMRLGIDQTFTEQGDHGDGISLLPKHRREESYG